MSRPPFRTAATLFLALLTLGSQTVPASTLAAEEEPAAATQPLAVMTVLATEPVALELPAFHDEKRAGVEIDDLFAEMPALPGRQWPREGDRVPCLAGKDLVWQTLDARDGNFIFRRPDGPVARYLAFFIDSDRYRKADLAVVSDQPVKAFLDGAKLDLSGKKSTGGEDEAETLSGEMTLAMGKHLVILRTLYRPPAEGEEEKDWSCRLAVEPGPADAEGLALDVTPRRQVDIQVVLDAPRLGRVVISPDGSQAAINLGEYRDGTHRESWVEIRDTDDGKLRHIWRTAEPPRGLDWSPDGKLVCWQTTTDKKTSIWYFDPDRGDSGLLLADVENLGGWQWTPDSKSIIYSVTRSPEPDPRKVKHVLNPADRQSWWRNRSHLVQAFVPGGLTRRLTAGPVGPGGWSVSPDSKRLLFFTSEPDLAHRPYSTSELWLMDLATLETTSVLKDPWIGGASWSPDGQVLLLQGSPSAFDGLGRNLPEGMQANDYGGQLYLYDLETARPTPITVDFRPDVAWSAWSVADGMIYARCTDTQYSNIYRFDPDHGKWSQLDTGFEYTDQIALPRRGHAAVVRGTSATTPNRLHTLDLKKNKHRLLLDPGRDDYRDRVFGKVENWSTTLPGGMELDGFVYYPPGFDPARKYPLIVYYYGGTSPVTRDFGGRYPKNIWAGQGYIVYVPEPSGATGYGQEFAARHVNDWGILTADEVIEGTKAFLAAHPFADPEAVGCIGASYGGFLTEYIVTRTDIFAAAVSHAGISSISSYWGEGLWGYAYGARALANAFPWQDRELYVEQSPLFHADRITTPLLLVHGDADTNVPVGESDQLFTALKLLGREVEYVQIQGQDHHILDHDQRIVWNDTILAFFARYLKGRPAWWEALYPEPEDFR